MPIENARGSSHAAADDVIAACVFLGLPPAHANSLLALLALLMVAGSAMMATACRRTGVARSAASRRASPAAQGRTNRTSVAATSTPPPAACVSMVNASRRQTKLAAQNAWAT